ncbi:hypothetical protein KR093_009768 [Drosophila rubida]|uniref:Decapping nuclease n=1 Tax=Drosophila rubida TaxID=30044 RepID=A0AAD4KC13_9MUSC|nr:hypothetical protein KR093_009768 [Drosophila rubida]
MSTAKKKRGDRGTLYANVHLHRSGTNYTGVFPHLSRPRPIGCYSINEACQFQDDTSNACYLRLPPHSEFPLDLNAGIKQVQRKGVKQKYHNIHQLFQYICIHQERLLQKSDTNADNGAIKLPYEFVTFRGILRQIMCTPYERRKDYRLMATRFNGTIYLAKVETEADIIERETMSGQMKTMCSWGYKFEQYCTTPDPKVAPDTSTPVNENKEFACIYDCELNGLRLFYGAEMDGIKSDVSVDLNDPKQLEAAEFVELKTCAKELNYYQKRAFDSNKTLNWWCQSFLVGIRSIYVGLRDRAGFTREIKEFAVNTLHCNKPWSPAAVSTFLANFLKELKLVMERIDKSDAIVMVDFKAGQGRVSYTVLPGDNVQDEEEQFLPPWYRQLFVEQTPPSHE